MLRKEGIYKVQLNNKWTKAKWALLQYAGEAGCFYSWVLDGICYSDSYFQKIGRRIKE